MGWEKFDKARRLESARQFAGTRLKDEVRDIEFEVRCATLMQRKLAIGRFGSDLLSSGLETVVSSRANYLQYCAKPNIICEGTLPPPPSPPPSHVCMKLCQSEFSRVIQFVITSESENASPIEQQPTQHYSSMKIAGNKLARRRVGREVARIKTSRIVPVMTMNRLEGFSGEKRKISVQLTEARKSSPGYSTENLFAAANRTQTATVAIYKGKYKVWQKNCTCTPSDALKLRQIDGKLKILGTSTFLTTLPTCVSKIGHCVQSCERKHEELRNESSYERTLRTKSTVTIIGGSSVSVLQLERIAVGEDIAVPVEFLQVLQRHQFHAVEHAYLVVLQMKDQQTLQTAEGVIAYSDDVAIVRVQDLQVLPADERMGIQFPEIVSIEASDLIFAKVQRTQHSHVLQCDRYAVQAVPGQIQVLHTGTISKGIRMNAFELIRIERQQRKCEQPVQGVSVQSVKIFEQGWVQSCDSVMGQIQENQSNQTGKRGGVQPGTGQRVPRQIQGDQLIHVGDQTRIFEVIRTKRRSDFAVEAAKRGEITPYGRSCNEVSWEGTRCFKLFDGRYSWWTDEVEEDGGWREREEVEIGRRRFHSSRCVAAIPEAIHIPPPPLLKYTRRHFKNLVFIFQRRRNAPAGQRWKRCGLMKARPLRRTTPPLLEVYATAPHESRDPNQPIANFRCISVAPEEARFSELPPPKSLSLIKLHAVMNHPPPPPPPPSPSPSPPPPPSLSGDWPVSDGKTELESGNYRELLCEQKNTSLFQNNSKKQVADPYQELIYNIKDKWNQLWPQRRNDFSQEIPFSEKSATAPIYQLQTKQLASKLITSVRRAQNAQSLLTAVAMAYEYREYREYSDNSNNFVDTAIDRKCKNLVHVMYKNM
ncbi:hypothetical protein WN51_05842 [Melipona quadrifasciata]|uniref:Uncharacterized protein n=1 Tax=Melipona quadrifasciata TaxID=166423 RepID=A0A0N0BIM6_9HYME|nr:hypothetical protein WN51_05842 [Melipona quadrifasciata]